MKKIKNLAFIVLATFILPITTAQSTCIEDQPEQQCNDMLGSYVLIKSFEVEHQATNQETEYSYVFCKGTNYILTVCENEPGSQKMIIELYDKNKKLVATNYNAKTKKFYHKMGYPCQSTGVYYMKYKFLPGTATCGLGMIGFKKS